MPRRRASRILSIAALTMLTTAAAAQSPLESRTTYSRTTAPAQAIGSVSVVLKAQQLEFNFGGGTASLGPKGDWTVQGRVNHRGLFCAEYSLGVRFGIGRPGCSKVAWLTDVDYVTNLRQCNNAALNHSGGDAQPELADSFAQITCAERVVRCVGACQ
jgi:hypothetical protein